MIKLFFVKVTYLLLSIFLFVNNHCLSQQIYMNVKKTDGSVYSFNIKDIQKLTFGGNLVDVDNYEKLTNAFKTLTLLKSYPNPFNQLTTIEYSIPKRGKVGINIYDESGRLIKSVLHKMQDKGTYKIKWNGDSDKNTKVDNGLYFIRIRYNDNILTKKVVLITKN